MKYTLLDFVQKTLSAIDSQNVSDVSASPESEQVVLIVNRVYEDMLSRRDWPFLRTVGVNLVTTGPELWELTLPSDTMTLEYLRYNKKDLIYKTPAEFKYDIDFRDTSKTEVNSDGIYTDRNPSYWTSYDDETITFDAYDSTFTGLLPALCYIQYIKDIGELTDNSDIPELPTRFHNVMLNGVLAIAFDELAQDTTKSQRKEAEFKKGMSRMFRWARNFKESMPKTFDYDFGRKANYVRTRICRTVR